jgi:proteasome lid subunit RPN8/RPN11
MWDWLRRRLKAEPPTTQRVSRPRAVLAEGCLNGITESMAGTQAICHEGVVYLLGTTDGETTVAVTAFLPEARTTRGSFEVSSVAMARVVRAASDLSLHVVGQIHSHPGGAGHSDGDVTGARIKYPGYLSIVVPEYGRHLPALDGAATYMYRENGTFVLLEPSVVSIAPGRFA